MSCADEAQEKNENDAIKKDKALINSMTEKVPSDSFKSIYKTFLKTRPTRSASLRKGVTESWRLR
jgi:hypothetical protein